MKPLHSSSSRLFQPSAFRLSGFLRSASRLFQPSAFRLSGFSLLLASALLLGGALRAQTVITGTVTTAPSLGAGETVIASGAWVFVNTTGVQTTGGNANTMTLTIEAGGMVGQPLVTSTNLPVQGINFTGLGRAIVNNHGSIIMGGSPTATTADNRYALRVNNNTGATLGGAEIYNTGFIFSAYDAIMSLNSAEFILVNSGTIRAFNMTALDPERGIYIRDGSSYIDITNSGLITAGGIGISFKNNTNLRAENFLITNSGTIETTRTNLAASFVTPTGSGDTFGATAAIAIGRAAFGGGSGLIDNTGLLSGAYTGIYNTGTSITINNTGGTIQGTSHYGIISIVDAGQTAPFIRVNNDAGLISGGVTAISVAAGSGTIANTGGGIITGAQAITAATGAVSVTNSAASTINGSSSAATEAAISTSAAATLFLDNAGLVEGVNQAIYLAGAASITNSGTINATDAAPLASIFFAGTGAAESSLTLKAGSVLTGDVLSAKAAGNHLFLEGAGVMSNNFLGATTSGAFNAANGFESLTLSNASWSLSGTIAISGNGADAISLNSSTLSLSGALLLPGSAGITLSAGMLTLDFAGDTTFAGAIVGDGAITHAGAGTIEMTGANTYTGVTTVLTGTLKGSTGASALHLDTATATYIVDPGSATATFAGITGAGVLDLQNADLVFDLQGASTTQTYSFAGTLDSNGGNKLVKTGDGRLVLAQSLASQLNGGTEIHDGILSISDMSHIVATGLILGGGTTAGVIEYTGAGNWGINVTLAGAGGGFSVASGSKSLAINVAGSGAFVKDGAGTLDISGVTFAAGVNATEIHNGQLIATAATLRGDVLLSSAGATLVYDHDSPVDFTDGRAISGAGNLVKTGAGLLNLTGDITYTGNTTVQSGTLQGKIGTGGLEVVAGATYKVADGDNTFQLAGITGGGNVDLNAASLILDVAAGSIAPFNFSGNLTSSNPQSKLVKTGAGTTDLQGAVVLPGGVEVQDGALRLADQSFITTPIKLGSGAAAGLIEYTGASPWYHDIELSAGGGGGFSVASGAQTLSGFDINGTGDFVKAGAGSLDITAANITDTANGSVRVLNGALRGSAATLKSGGISLESASASIEFNQPAGAAAYSSPITGAGSLLKSGQGDLALTGANSYGATRVAAGLLEGNIGLGALTVDASGTYRVAAGTSEFTTSGVQGNGVIDLLDASIVFDVASGVSQYSFTGTLLGGNQLVKKGAGALELLSAVALNGSLVNEGIVRLASQDFLRTPVTLGSGVGAGFIEYNGATPWSSSITLAGQGGGFVVGAGEIVLAGQVVSTAGAPFIKDGAGILDATAAAFTGVGSYQVRAGTLRGDAAALSAATAAIDSGATFELRQDAPVTFSGVTTGAGGFLKSGAGVMTATGVLGHTGFTRISQGRLVIGAPGVLPSIAQISTAPAGALDIGFLQQSITTLDNNGAVHVTASVNSRAGIIHSAGRLEVTGPATGSGQILVNLTENNAYSPSAPEFAVIASFSGPTSYTFGLATREVDGPYDWTVQLSPSGNNVILAKGELSPEVPAAAGIDAGAFLAGKGALDSISRRLAAQRATRNHDNSMQLWAQWLRYEDTLDEDLYKKTSAITNGFQVGAEWDLTDLRGARTGARDKTAGSEFKHRLVGGLYYDSINSTVKIPGGFATSSADFNGFGAYASYRSDWFYLDLALRNARNKYNGEVFYGEISRFRASGYSLGASLEIGGQLASKSPWKVEPQARITFLRHTIDPFVDGMGRRIEVECNDSQEGLAAVRISRQFANEERTRVISPYLRAGLAYEAKGGARINFTDPAAPESFTNKRDGSLTRVEAGVACLLAHGFRLQLDASWYEGARINGKSIQIGAGFTW